MTDESVRIVGLAELERELGRAERAMPSEIKKADHAAADFIAKTARANAEGLGGVAAKSAPSVRAEGDKFVLGGGEFPFARGAEFGASAYPQFKPYRGDGDDGGYFALPAIRTTEEAVAALYGDTAERVTAPAFPN